GLFCPLRLEGEIPLCGGKTQPADGENAERLAASVASHDSAFFSASLRLCGLTQATLDVGLQDNRRGAETRRKTQRDGMAALELHPESELNITRTYIGSAADLAETAACQVGVGSAKLRVIEGVEKFGPELGSPALPVAKALHHGYVGIARAAEAQVGN